MDTNTPSGGNRRCSSAAVVGPARPTRLHARLNRRDTSQWQQCTGILPCASKTLQNTAHRCTPPMPPVTNTLMPARAASSMVPLTVVAPSRPLPTTSGISRRDTLRTDRPLRAMCSSCCLSQPAQREGQRWHKRAGVEVVRCGLHQLCLLVWRSHSDRERERTLLL